MLKFKPEPIGKTLEQDDLGKLNCNAQAATDPRVTWFRYADNTVVPITDSHIQVANGSIFFRPAKKTDAGYYTCVATAGSEIINKTVKVEVYGKMIN